jgi:hypothetical protein
MDARVSAFNRQGFAYIRLIHEMDGEILFRFRHPIEAGHFEEYLRLS